MIKPNWEIFKAKFSENPQNNFEWFCYLLFCKEFDRPYGIFRFKNQSTIETNPIELDNGVIGWQAKFYDTPISNHKDEILVTIENLKRYYPQISKLLFYTNQEWAQSKGKIPQGLIEIEKKAKDNNIILDWRTSSYFESEFVSIKNEIIAKHFFSLGKSIFTIIDEMQKHTENILNNIKTCFSFKGNVFEILRNNQIERIKDESQLVTIISGVAGVGKTVIIKKIYEQLKENTPFYVFKATEFELRNINELLKDYSLYSFIDAHNNEKTKIIVIDSAEKLIDLKNTDPFKELLSLIIRDNWKIIFTTRYNYLEDLNFQFFEIYNIAPLNIRIDNLELNEIIQMSEGYSFPIPKDDKLLELIKNPFYLNEYLKFYNDTEEINYNDFRTKLWNTIIKKSKPEREQCFLQIAFERANSGQFFNNPKCDNNILNNELVRDGLLGYELAGYFITHDIYEEWALEKIIESEFIKKTSEQEFLKKIGQSLPVRRSFRNWLSGKLFVEDADIKYFIEDIFKSNKIQPFWKDEIVVSILLSNYSKRFFEIFKDELISNEQKLLRRLIFILRITCKEVDDDYFTQLGLKKINLFSLKYILTKPKGKGWEDLIKFVYDYKEQIGIKNINYIIPVIYDWNNKIKKGETTKYSSLIALQYYQMIIDEDNYYYDENDKENILKTIIWGSYEIKNELKDIFEEILRNKWKNYRDKYYDFSRLVLTKLEGIWVSKVLPEHVIKLADLFWTYTPRDRDQYYQSFREVEQYFGLESRNSEFHPASAYQTPIYWLLQFNLKDTIDFTLNFTNRSIDCYANSGFDKSVQKVKVFIDDKNEQDQYISHCLWNMYRGTSSPVSPNLLQSIHMALEKYFLEIGKNEQSDILEKWLLYLLKKSNTASISSVVTSIVLAYPEKTFNVAKVLFKTKEFVIYDTNRFVTDKSAKTLYSIGLNMGIRTNELYDEERIKTCEDKHRQWTLEGLLLYYQCFRDEKTSEESVIMRQKLIWEILDNYYKGLPHESMQSEADKTWRLFLARMDRRKMNVTTEKTDDGVAILFNPEIESDIKEQSEKTQKKYNEHMKYISLKLWAELKFDRDDKYKQYDKYENDPLCVIREVKDIVHKLKIINSASNDKEQISDKEGFVLFNYSIPAYACSVLIENNIDELTVEDKNFCKDVILEVASSSLEPNYHYQISDGVQPAILSLPVLLENFPEEKEKIKIILLLTLFNECSVGGLLASERFNIFSIMAIRKLWKKNFNDAQSLLLGYLLLKQRYDDLEKRIVEKNHLAGIYRFHDNELLEIFIKDNEEIIQNVIRNKLIYENLKDIDKLDLHILKTAFNIIPPKTYDEDHKKIAKIIISSFASKIILDHRDEKIDYTITHDFLRIYSYFLLNLNKDEIHEYLEPFLEKFNSSETFADYFTEIILAEDILKTDEKFWLIWNIFKDKILQLCKDGDRQWNIGKIIKSYLFAQVHWKDTAKEWHALKDNNKLFFKNISENIGHCPSTLYSISKLLNDIGSSYLDDGIIWISNILEKNHDYVNKKLETNTIYYLENIIRKL